MADPRILSRIIQLGKELGANISNSIGTKSNVNFLGSGPKDGMLFQKDINPESFLAIGTQKVLPDIEASIGYASGNKLNGFQLEQLEKNLITMKESLNPTNVVDMGGAGIDSLRARSGLVERQATDAASDTSRVKKEAVEKYGISPERFDEVMNSKFDEKLGDDLIRETSDTSPLMSKLENRVEGIRDSVGSPFNDYRKNVLQEGNEAASGIMETVAKVDLPGKRAASREFLVNSLKVGDEASSTTLSDVMSAQDMKYIMEGGGGVMGDPIVLVQKYFGPRIAEMVPANASSEEMVIFTRRVMNNVEDAKGFRPDEPEFDAMTAMFVDNLADGGRAGFRSGGFSILGSNNMTDAVIRRIEALMDEGLDFGSAYKQVTKEVPVLQKKDGGRINYAKGGLAKILEL